MKQAVGISMSRTGPDLRFKVKEEADGYLKQLQVENVAGIDEVGRGCERPDAEVLTERGWLSYTQLSTNDRVLSYTDKGCIVWQKVDKIIERTYTGNLLELKNRSVHMVVTPDHCFTTLQRVHQRDKNDQNRLKVVGYKNKYKCVSDLVDNDSIPRGGLWSGESPATFTLPSMEKFNGFRPKEILPEKKIPIDVWVAFIGIYLAEGCCTKGKKGEYIVLVSQTPNSQHYNKIYSLLKSLPFNFQKDGKNGFRVFDKQLYLYLNKLGNVYNKFVPAFVKNLNYILLNTFLTWAVFGDGTTSISKGRLPFHRYYTSSIPLKNDIEEILLKAGWTCHTKVKTAKASKNIIKSRVIVAKADNYETTFRRSDKITVKYLKKTLLHYEGKVFCLALPKHHNFYVRRSGTGYFTGNSLAGPVVAACVLLHSGHGIKGIKDSKRLSPRRREVLAEQIMAKSWWALGSKDSREIDNMNIYKATLASAAAAAIKCQYKGAPIDFLLCDGGLVLEDSVPFPTAAAIKGDDWFECIGAASIVAKVHRDLLMKTYHTVWPEYGFNTNAGYGTKVHVDAIHKYGMVSIHRRSYGICKTAKERGSFNGQG